MNRLTEAAQNMTPPQGIKGRQILKLLLNHLQTGVEDDQTFKIAELTSLKCRQTGHSDDEARLRSYLSTWDNLIFGIKRKIDDGVLLAVFIGRYDPLARKSDPSPSRSVRSGRDGKPDGKPRSSSPGRSSQRDRASPGRGSQRDKRTPSPKSPSMAGSAGSSTTRAPGTLLHPLHRGLVIGPLGTGLCSSDTATTGCMASAQLSRASTCIRSHHRVRSLSRLVLLLIRLLRMKRGIPLGRLRPALPIGRRGVSTAPLLPQQPAGLRRVASLLALAVGRKASEARCSSPVLLVEVNRCREAGYGHPNAIKFPSRKKIAREVQSALIRAAAVHAQVLLDNDEDIDTNLGDLK